MQSRLTAILCALAVAAIAQGAEVPKTPAQTFKGLPGWLGLATIEGKSNIDAPGHKTAHVAVSEEPQAWVSLGTATKLRALAPGLSEVVNFVATESVVYRCDDSEETFAFFKGMNRPPRGVVWLVPTATAASVRGVVALADADTPKGLRAAGQKEMRAWQVGDGWTFVVRRMESAFTAEIWQAQTRLWQESQAWQPMEGDEGGPPTLAQGGPGIRMPRMLLTSGATNLLLVQTDGYEGTNFDGLFLEQASARWAEGRVSLYWCAF